jgi:hypothetical protein
MKSYISEDIVVRIWQSAIFPELETTTGETIRIIHPGRFTHGQPGDFQDAVLLINGQRVYGSVEAHVNSSQWYSHKHHRNPRYNNTILHVTYRQDTQMPTMLNNGQIIPIITLDTLLTKHCINSMTGSNVLRQDAFYCPHLGRFSVNKQLQDILAMAGIERLHGKANYYRQALQTQETGLLLFAGICRAMGYSQNSQAFEKLACKLQQGCLEQFEEQIMQQALLLGTAGLLPSQRSKKKTGFAHDIEIEELEQNWKASGWADNMNETEWCFFRVRPANFPTRRIAALSYLLDRYRQSGLVNGIFSLFPRASTEIHYGQLIQSLKIPEQGYWANHCDFNIPMMKTLALIGDNKAADILVNTVLPFAHAWSQTVSDPKLKWALEELYRSFPGSADNELTHYMKRQLGISDKNLTTCHQQGLLHIFKIHCRYRDCSSCPVVIN